MLFRLIYRMRSFLTARRIAAFFLEEKLRRKPRYKSGHVQIGKYNWVYADSASFLSAFRQIMVYNWYAYNRDLVKKSPIILDCGANIGLATLYFAMSSPEAKIIGFEPDPVLYKMLKENIVSNNLANMVDLVNAALWIGNEETSSFCPDGADGGYLDIQTLGNISVPVVSLRRYLSEPIGLVKMDIEGAETEVLMDSYDLLPNIKQIIVEHHSMPSRPQRLDEFLGVLEKAGFRLQINNVHRWMNPLVRASIMGRHDQLLTVYGYRV